MSLHDGGIFIVLVLIITGILSMICTNDKLWKYVADRLLGLYALGIIYLRKFYYFISYKIEEFKL